MIMKLTKSDIQHLFSISIKTLVFLFIAFLPNFAFAQKKAMPNVVIILADDVGYGDLACHGNTVIKTPNLDSLYAKSSRFTNFHVGTTCSPTRAMLMTGKNNNKVGVWHTVNGREILNKEEKIMPQYFKEAGYRTGIFGKWHLGDSYPFRPQDRGFDEVLIHGGGGVGQTPDFWGNDYFADTYFRNGKPEKFEKYCDDVWFDEAIKFMSHKNDKPFLCYIPTNVAHEPYNVAPEYADLYAKNKNVVNPAFYGMITKMDENIGRMMVFLKNSGLDKNTIVVFLSDNGTSAGGQLDKEGFVTKGYNAKMRGKKGAVYEGGHRVPCFIHIPFLECENKEINSLSLGTDLLPTLLDLCKITHKPSFEGVSLLPLLMGNSMKERTLVVDTQRGEYLKKNQSYAVMTQRWRMVNGVELYDITNDPEQQKNIASTFKDTLNRLQKHYEKWWAENSKQKADYQRVIIGTAFQPEVCLTSHDLHVENGLPAWNQEMVKEEVGENGFWAVDFAKNGNYEFELRRFPREANLNIPSKYIEITVVVNDKKYTQKIQKDTSKVNFRIKTAKGNSKIKAYFVDEKGKNIEAAYVYIRRK